MLYDLSSSYMEGTHGELAHRGYSRNGRKGTLQIVYGLLCAPDGCPVAIEVFDGKSGDPATLATHMSKLKQRFGLDHVILVGDRGMITEARLTEDVKPAGLDWIIARRGPVIKDLMKGGALQLSLFDERDIASITTLVWLFQRLRRWSLGQPRPEFPGERLIVCHNAELVARRAPAPGIAGCDGT